MLYPGFKSQSEFDPRDIVLLNLFCVCVTHSDVLYVWTGFQSLSDFDPRDIVLLNLFCVCVTHSNVSYALVFKVFPSLILGTLSS